MVFDFEKRRVLVTGGADGIGRNLVSAFAESGATVAFCDLDDSMAAATQKQLEGKGHTVSYIHSDLSAPGAPKKMVQDAADTMGGLDILINSARSGRRTSFEDESETDWDNTFSVTLKAAFFAAQEAARHMPAEGGGIVNIASIAGVLSCGESPSYHAAKAGLIQLTRYMAHHLGPKRIRVNCVVPAFIVKDRDVDRFVRSDNEAYRTMAEFAHPIGQVGSAGDVVAAVQFLASDEARFVTGQGIVLDGGMSVQDQSDLILRFGRSSGG